MNTNLFKSAEFYQRRYHNFATLLVLPLVLLVLFLGLFSLIAKKEVTITSLGEITPTTIIASIQSTSNNNIVANHLVNNQLIQKDSLLVEYSETMEQSQRESLESQLATLERQKSGLDTLKASLEQGSNLFSGNDEFGYVHTFQNFISQSQDIELGISKVNTEVNNQAIIASNTISTIDDQVNQIYQKIAEYEELRSAIISRATSLPSGNPHQATLNNFLTQSQAEGQSSLSNQYVNQIDQTISGLESSISNLNIQKSSTGSVSVYDSSLGSKIETLRTQFLQTTAQQKTTIENQITDLKAKLEQASVQLEHNIIKAPEAGVVHLNPEFEGKDLIPSGNEIAQIFPNIQETKEVYISYYVTSEYVSLLKEKQAVRLNLEKIGNQPITILGKVHTIDKTSTKTEKENLFKITALAKVPEKDAAIIQYGLQGRVTSVIAKKSFFDYYKDKLLKDYN